MLAILFVAAGCGRKVEQVVPVEGTVEYKGKPVVGAAVTFQPEHGKSATGVTDENGRFVLTTYSTGDGAVVGTHKVTIVPLNVPSQDKYEPESSAGKLDEVNEPITGDDAPTIKSTAIPAKYADPGSSGLKSEIRVGADNKPAFKLTD
jgi:hypothetical protein